MVLAVLLCLIGRKTLVRSKSVEEVLTYLSLSLFLLPAEYLEKEVSSTISGRFGVGTP